MRVLTSVLLAGILFCGHQATAKETVQTENYGDWTFTAMHDSNDNSNGYTLGSLSDKHDSNLVAGCYGNKNLISFSSKDDIRDTIFDDEEVVGAKVDNNESAIYLWRLTPINGKIALISSTSEEIEKFLNQLKNGNKLTIVIMSKKAKPLNMADFSLKGFERGYQKFLSACAK